ncbi:MAG: GNVR domain-containing protein [Patescibacteria group bacterium]
MSNRSTAKNKKNYLNLKLYAALTTVILILAVVFSLVFLTFKYSAQTSVIVVPKGSIEPDAVTAGLISDRLASNLAEVVYTSRFFYQTMDAGYQVPMDLFSNDEKIRRQQWQAAVSARVRPETGILDIIVYHKDSRVAGELANAIAYSLTLHGSEYTGLQNTEVRIIDAAIVSEFPVKPNIMIVLAIGLLLGLIVSFSVSILINEKSALRSTKPKIKEDLFEKENVSESLETIAVQPAPPAASKTEPISDFPPEVIETMPKSNK